VAGAPQGATYVRIVVDSDPHGAAVLVGGKPIGTTPFDERVTAGGPGRVYTLRKDGYEPATVTLATARDGAERIVLKKRPPAKPPAPPPTLGDKGINPFDH
jgi:hypothetical protein